MVSIPIDGSSSYLEGDLTIIEISKIRGIVIFAHGSASNKNSPRNSHVGRILNNAGFSTLLVDLLTQEEQDLDIKAQKLIHKIPGITLNKFNIKLLAKRLITITDWIRANRETQNFSIGYFGASTGAAAAIEAAAEARLRNQISAVISRGGRPDLASVNSLRSIYAPTLLIMGDKDSKDLINLNRKALMELRNAKDKTLIIIPGGGHLFEEPGTIEKVGRYSVDWFKNHIG